MRLLAIFAVLASNAAAVALDTAFTAKGPSDDYCNPGVRASTFATTDTAVWLYVSVSNASTGDRLKADWIRPDGVSYATSNFDPLPGPGGWCFGATIAVAGKAAQYPGNWTIRGSWNGAPLFTVGFSIAASAPPPPPPSAAPVITEGGIVNAASFMLASLPAGAIARGSFFSIFGKNLGPQTYQSQTAYPLADNLAGVTVKITKGTASVNAYPVFVSAGQINAILPSNAPTGDVQLTVLYRSAASAAASIKVADTNFGVFAAAAGMGPGIIQNYVAPGQLPLNSRSSTAKPGQVAILLGTGLGAIAGLDSQTPPVGDLPAAVQVTVGGKPATKLYSGRMPGVAGVDQINFQVPADAPSGCYVPVQVKAGGHYSNTVTMAIDARGQPCSDPQNPFAAISAQGGKGGSIFLIRLNMQLQLEASQPSIDLLLDLGLAAFEQNSPQGDLGFDPLFSLPPVGTCTAYGLTADISSILGGDLSGASGFPGFLGHDLDAGPSIAVSNSRNTVALEHMDTNSGPYFGLLGGTLPLGDGPSLPPFLNAGTVTITGAGGKDVGPFRASIDIGAPVVWSNRDQITQVDRAKDLAFTWSGGDDSKLILIGGAGSDMTTQATGLFFCFVPGGPGRFTVPASVLGNLPATGTNAFGALLLGSLPNGNYPKFTAAGLDWGSIFNAMLAAKTVAIQ